MKYNKAPIVIAYPVLQLVWEPQDLFTAAGNTNGTAALEDSSAFLEKLDLLYIRNHTPRYKWRT